MRSTMAVLVTFLAAIAAQASESPDVKDGPTAVATAASAGSTTPDGVQAASGSREATGSVAAAGAPTAAGVAPPAAQPGSVAEPGSRSSAGAQSAPAATTLPPITLTLTAPAAPADFKPPPGYRTVKHGLDVVYCTSITPVGSRLPQTYCMSREQIEQLQRQQENERRQLQEKSHAGGTSSG